MTFIVHNSIVILQSKVSEAEKVNGRVFEEKTKYAKLLEEERAMSLGNKSRVTVFIVCCVFV